MREHDLQPKRRRRFVATTDSDHDNPIFPDLARDRIVDGPNQVGWRISPTSRSPLASSIWPPSSTLGVDAFNRQHQIGFDFIYAAGSFHLISRRETSEQI